MEIICVTVDSHEPAEVARFWNAALGWGGVTVHPDGTGAISGPPSGGIYLEFVPVPETKVVKNRIHLGCAAGTLEQLDVELDRLQALGASIAWEEDFPAEIAAGYRNVILRDVEGNEFCLSGGSFPSGDAPTSSP
jgi:Glyoxalase-like domain